MSKRVIIAYRNSGPLLTSLRILLIKSLPMIMVAGLQPLTSLYPNVVAKEDFLTPNKLAPFKNYSSQLAALDFKSCATARRCIRNDKFRRLRGPGT
ncbi:protein ROOT HAIR SPECIFIC 17-like [Daucus carota subsp. sativus]|uniref:protein ROOT HAIR SPECIFIC 17-like n=1 Tax=Daucus carota subsp. sativus TaxID=79200 RepID=UPI0030836767